MALCEGWIATEEKLDILDLWSSWCVTIIIDYSIFVCAHLILEYMNKKVLIPAIIVIVLVVAAGFLAARKGAEHPAENDTANTNNTANVSQDTPQSNPSGQTTPPDVVEPPAQPALPAADTQTQGHFSAEQDIEGVDVQVFEIVYNGDSFSPSTLFIKNGDIIIFKNESKGDFWPASNPHPLHTDYPEFDPKKPVAAGKTYEFKFTKAGTWKFHDHLNSPARGTIVVK